VRDDLVLLPSILRQVFTAGPTQQSAAEATRGTETDYSGRVTA
jgi:hypothetical protein